MAVRRCGGLHCRHLAEDFFEVYCRSLTFLSIQNSCVPIRIILGRIYALPNARARGQARLLAAPSGACDKDDALARCRVPVSMHC